MALEQLRPARLDLYVGAPRILEGLAHVSGVRLSEGSMDNLVQASTLIGLIDHVVDRADQPLIDETMQYWSDLYDHDPPLKVKRPDTIDCLLAESAENLRVNLSGKQAVSFITCGREAIALAGRYRASCSSVEYAKLTFEEGVKAAGMFEAAIEPSDIGQPRFERFIRELHLLGGVSNVLDSVYDLSKDSARGETVLPSTLLTRLGMVWGIRYELAKTAKDVNWRLSPLIGRSALAFLRAWRRRRIDRQQLGSIAVVPRSDQS